MPDPDDLEIADDDPIDTEQDNAAEPAQVRERQRTQAQINREIGNFWRKVFADPVGRKAMWDLLGTMHPFETKYGVGPNGFPNDMASVAYMAEQQLGLRLFMTWQIHDMEGVSLMQREYDPRLPKPKKRKRGA